MTTNNSPVTDAMVSRFLSWRLPADFAPDCGISFKRESDYDHPEFGRTKYEPTGTNLLHAGQARAMLEHVLGAKAPAAVASTLPEVITSMLPPNLAAAWAEPAPDARPKPPEATATTGETAPKQQPNELAADPIEAEIQAKGLTAPRVTKARIDDLMARIVYTCDQRPNGSTTTLVHAFLDGDFYLATGVSACVSVANFDASIGRNIATANAESAAQDKLWELEGYALRDRLAQGGAA